MKKTMIAMAVAGVVAAPIASADVKISGVVEQTFTDTENDTNGMDTSTFNMLNVTASEDLGNGMTAFAKYNHLTTAGTNTGETNGDQVVGISGDFGTVVAGTMEDFTEGKLAAMMTMEGNGSVELTGNSGRTAGGLAYITPTVSGFHAGVAGYAGSGAVDTDSFDAVDVAIFYDNGPLSIKVAQETENKGANASTTYSETNSETTGAATATTTAAAEDQTTTSVGASYTIGDLKVSALHVSRENQGGTSGADSDDTMVKVDYTMGNNKISVGYASDDSVTGADNDTVTAVELIHNFSGRTSAYIGHVDNTVEGTTPAITEDASTYFGIKHKF